MIYALVGSTPFIQMQIVANVSNVGFDCKMLFIAGEVAFEERASDNEHAEPNGAACHV